MNCLKIAIASTFCLQGSPLSGIKDPCLNYNKVNKTCDCCRSGWTGQDCKIKCLNCGSRFVRNKCETFCQIASYYGTFCNIPCPSACLRNGQCNESCATHQESTKDTNQGRADSEATGTGASSQSFGPVSFSPRIEGAVISIALSQFTIAICCVGYVVYKTVAICRKWRKALQDKRKSERRTTAESLSLTSFHDVNDDVIDSSTHTETADVPTQAELLKVDKSMIEEMSQPIQERPDGDDTFHVHTFDAVGESNMNDSKNKTKRLWN
ncbi:uncharacterized protein LOC124275365 [Haliotis rubra]|uniref:uncharacterized protein LOC124275365 n=1 Tax=Haliotis rubra TaxID=36100 RepID=UPI001EE51BFD|nr:uncharacterized protein LOC124275365 [Haliotis rubra]